MSLQMDHAEREHNEMRDLMQILDNTPISSEFWLEKFGELKHAIEHHVREEEDDVFPKAKVLLSPADARRLARDMDAIKARMRMENDGRRTGRVIRLGAVAFCAVTVARVAPRAFSSAGARLPQA
ncbi:MAG: hypothetical protein WDN06_11610 [Asticcacaulis sp.]